MTQPFTIIGRRAVYTRVDRRYDDDAKGFVETGRESFSGTIAALAMSHEQAIVVMLYDDGSLRQHAIDNVVLEGASPEGALR